jgi:hypothetical protein
MKDGRAGEDEKKKRSFFLLGAVPQSPTPIYKLGKKELPLPSE